MSFLELSEVPSQKDDTHVWKSSRVQKICGMVVLVFVAGTAWSHTESRELQSAASSAVPSPAAPAASAATPPAVPSPAGHSARNAAEENAGSRGRGHEETATGNVGGSARKCVCEELGRRRCKSDKCKRECKWLKVEKRCIHRGHA